MKNLFIIITSGLCNQLLPLISAHYLANKYKRKFYFNTKSFWIHKLALRYINFRSILFCKWDNNSLFFIIFSGFPSFIQICELTCDKINLKIFLLVKETSWLSG